MTEAQPPRISIVIRCLNEEQHVGRLLKGIGQQTVQDFKSIVVDSGSTDATLAVSSNYPVKVLSIRREEFSFGRSLNEGCKAAIGEFIVIASAHTYMIYRDWLERLIEPFSDPQVALVYGKQGGNEATKYSEHQIFAKWFPNESNSNQDHPFCDNANAAIRRSLWERLPYDEALTGLEDIGWAKQAMQLGYKVAYVADAEVVHVHNEIPARTYNRYRREAIALKHIYPQERSSFRDFVLLFIANVGSDYYHAWHDQVLGRKSLEIAVFRLIQFWGTYRGFAQRGPVGGRLRQTFSYPQRPRSTSQRNGQDGRFGAYRVHKCFNRGTC